jgi:eukaryotic-like serine/threonine-protein kinase
LKLEAGTVVAARYRIIRPLGRGGMGEVFAAENIRTGRQVAIKLLRADSKSKSQAVKRFRREARAAGSINSDHVTQVLDVEEDPEHGIVLVFELLEGESLIDRLKRTGPIAFEELYSIIEQVWMGLADAHRIGIIHRDLKPSNVFLEARPDGSTRVKILDFGISKLPKEMGVETLTEVGQSLGTFSFMPPEQIGKAKTVDHRADIYACTTLIYQAMSGQLPYQARNILYMVELKTKSEARKLADAMDGPVDPRLEAFLARGLARDPALRFQSALEGLNEWRELRPHGVSSQPGSGAGLPSSRRFGPSVSVPSLSHLATSSSAPPHGYPAFLTPVPGAPLVPVTANAPAVAANTPPDLSETVMRSPAGRDALAQTLPDPSAQRSDGHGLQYASKAYPASQPSRRTGPYGTAVLEQQPSSGRMQPVPPFASGPASSHKLPVIYEDTTSSGGPASQERTHVYHPSRPSMGSLGPMDSPTVAPVLQQSLPMAKSASPGARRLHYYVMAAIACALLGFLVVAIAIRMFTQP